MIFFSNIMEGVPVRISFLIIHLIVIGSQVICLVPYVYSQEFDYELGGVIYEQPSYLIIKDDNFLNPDNNIIKLSEWTNRIYGRISFDLYYKKAKFISQIRPTFFLDEDKEIDSINDIDLITDDAYLDMDMGNGYFLFAGRKNIRDGVAYGANPTDFLGEDKKVDSTKREEERRIERKGNYLIGGDAFFKNITLSAIYAPEISDFQDERDRVLLKADFFAESINTDMSLHIFNGDIPGIGFNISSTVSDNLVLHTESAFRWGSDNKDITIVSEGSNMAPRIFQITDADDDDRVYPHIVIGESYTFGDGTNIICEYIYNGDGLNSSEWDELTEFIKYNHDAYRNDFFKGLALGNLGQANAIMNFRNMRKNYIFIRLSNSKILENTDGQLVFYVNADDMSYLTFLSIDYNLGTNTVAGLSSTVFAGENDAEFGMMQFNSNISLVLKYFF